MTDFAGHLEKIHYLVMREGRNVGGSSRSVTDGEEKEMTRKDIEDKIANVVVELKKTDFYLSVSTSQSLL